MSGKYRDPGTYIADDGQLGECVEYFEPDSDVLTFLRDRSTCFTDELVCVETYLKPVVE